MHNVLSTHAHVEHHTISTLRRNGTEPSHIAHQLGRHVSTINRELRRNAAPEEGYQYPIIAKACNRSAAAVSMVIMTRLLQHRAKLHTLTFDNEKEFASHAMIDKILYY
ncbi:helix-turn-helix domain-containing protein [Akkermansiaceae bacterium]|nr:helix-turn-helix domain-containing protein [Akkermansiaceae bacterium]